MLVVAANPTSDSTRPTAASTRAARQHRHARSAWPGAAFPRRLRRECSRRGCSTYSPQSALAHKSKLMDLSSGDAKYEFSGRHGKPESAIMKSCIIGEAAKKANVQDTEDHFTAQAGVEQSPDSSRALSITFGDRLSAWAHQLRGEKLLRFIATTLCILGTLGILFRDYAQSRATVGTDYSLIRFLDEGSGIWYFLLLFLLGAVSVMVRAKSPLMLLTLELVELFLGVSFGIGLHSYTQVAFLVVIYLCIRLPLYGQAMCDLGMIIIIMSQYSYPSYLQPHYLLLLYAIAAVGIISSLLSIARDRHAANRRLSEAQWRAAVLAEEKNKTERRLRMANELHDSVGHGLTSIIALSQGGEDCARTGNDANPQLAGAFAEISSIAKESLGNTRRILKVFNEEEANTPINRVGPEPVNQDDVLRLRDWDDIRPVLEHIRSTGIIVIFTETGSRVDDPRRSDLCFAITREALTNALRHGSGLTRVAVAWDHLENGGTSISIRNNGHTYGRQRNEVARKNNARGGTGLSRLAQRIAKVGGTLSYGPSESGWTVKALIP